MSFARMLLLLFAGTLLPAAIGLGTTSHPQAVADEPAEAAAAAPAKVFSAAERADATRTAVRRLILVKSLQLRTPRDVRLECREVLRDSEKLDAVVSELRGVKGSEFDAAAEGAKDLPDLIERLLAVLQKYWPFIQEMIKFVLTLFANPEAALSWLARAMGFVV